MHDLDSYIQSQLLLSALKLTLKILVPSPKSTFVAKIFRGRDSPLLFSQLLVFFENVHCAKPRSSRGSSLESFVVCRGLKFPDGWTDDSFDNFINASPEISNKIVPFVACGDLSGFDSDATYSTEAEQAKEARGGFSLDPIMPPTNVPYKTAISRKREQSTAKRDHPQHN